MDLYILFFLSLLAFALFSIDKHLSFYSNSHIPEWLLITSTAIGGAFGSLVAMILFRHLTNNRTFLILVPVLAVFFVLIDVLYRLFLL